MLDINL